MAEPVERWRSQLSFRRAKEVPRHLQRVKKEPEMGNDETCVSFRAAPPGPPTSWVPPVISRPTVDHIHGPHPSSEGRGTEGAARTRMW